MAEKISKQTIKDYFEITNTDLATQLKEKMDNSDDWPNFKRELISLIYRFANTPNRENRIAINEYTARYFTRGEERFAEEAVKTILRGLGISERTNMPVPHQSQVPARCGTGCRRSGRQSTDCGICPL